MTLADGRHVLTYNHSTRGTPDAGGKGRGILNLSVSNDGIDWEAGLVIDYTTGSRYSYPTVIQTSDCMLHVTYTHGRYFIRIGRGCGLRKPE